MFKSIRWRLTLVYLFIVTVSLMTIGGYFLWRIETFYMENLKKHMFSEARAYAELFTILQERGDVEEKINEVCKRLRGGTATRVTFIAGDGRVLGDSHEEARLMENHLARPEVQGAMELGEGFSRRYSSTVGMEMFYVALLLGEGNSHQQGFVRLAVPLSYINQNVAQLRNILISGLLLALLISLLLSLRFSGKLISPLEEIGRVARAIASGNFDSKVKIRRGDELGALARTINEMGLKLKEKVQQISREKSKLETVMSAMTSGVILCDFRGRIDFMNEAAGKIFGVEKKNVSGLPFQAVIRNFVFYEKLQESLNEGEMKTFELSLFFPETKVIQAHVIPIRGTNGEDIMGVLAMVHDITGIRSLERMRSEFVANVSHELRTPLTTIKGYAETLLDENNWRDRETVRRILIVIDKEAERLARLLKDLLNLSQIESSKGLMKKEKIKLGQVIKESVALLESQAEEKGLKLELSLPEKDPETLRGDPDWLLQLFIDLLDNAIKYTPAGGMISVKLKETEKEAVVSVSDTGIGIPAKHLPYIFERFYRVDKARSRSLGSTGLGLAMVKHIVEAHGGRVEVESAVGEGTTFTVYLPLVN